MDESEDRLTAVFERLADPVLVVDRTQRIGLANRAARALFGADCRGAQLVSVIRQPKVLRAVARVLAGRERAGASFLQRRPVETSWRVNVQPLDDAGGGAVLEFRDRTQIELARQIRSDFVANVSHELRSPLTALTGFIETLQGPAAEDAEARAAFLQTMQEEAARMKRLIDDLLSLSRVEAAERVRPRDDADIAALLRDLLKRLAPQASKQGCGLELSGAERGAVIPGDRDQLTQVFANLIENALKYAPGAPVSVTLSDCTPPAGFKGPALAVAVRDGGPGIAAEHIPRLSERFYRVDSHRSRALGGTGLGLAIVKHIVSRHRGRLLIESTPGEGSCFTVILPRS